MKSIAVLLALAACSKSEPTKTEPVKEPAKTEPAKAEPMKTEPPTADPSKAEPTKAEPTKAEPKSPPVVELPAEYERREQSEFLMSIRVPKAFKSFVSPYDDYINFEGPYTFAVEAFVPEKSSQSMSESKDLVKSLGKDTFVKFTLEHDADSSWRLDWDEKDGRAGTTTRIANLDCGASGLTPANRDIVAAMCASIEKMVVKK
jgi:hypothetical protein